MANNRLNPQIIYKYNVCLPNSMLGQEYDLTNMHALFNNTFTTITTIFYYN